MIKCNKKHLTYKVDSSGTEELLRPDTLSSIPFISTCYPDGSTLTNEQYEHRLTANGSMSNVNDDALITNIKGNTVKFNQLLSGWNSGSEGGYSHPSGSVYFTITNDSATTPSAHNLGYLKNIVPRYKSSHKYICISNTHAYDSYISLNHVGSGGNYGINTIYTITNPSSISLVRVRINVAIPLSVLPVGGSITFTLNIIDLTEIFGVGNEPTSFADFETWLATNIGLRDYYEYNAGSLLPVTMTGIKSIGFNQFDNSTLRSGVYIRPEDGSENYSYPSRVGSTTFFKCIPGRTYYFRAFDGSPSSNYNIVICFYDENKRFLNSTYRKTGAVLTMASNCHYFRISSAAALSSNIHFNVNFSDQSLNNTYKAYEETTKSIPITTLTGKLNGTGNSVVVFPNGMRKINNVYDEIKIENGIVKAIKRVGSVDLGSVYWNHTGEYKWFYFTLGSAKRPADNWTTANILTAKYVTTTSNYAESHEGCIGLTGTSGTVRIYETDTSLQYPNVTTTQYKTAKNGEILYYELATPQEYILDESLPKDLLKRYINFLPSGYLKLEYLESSGTLYIDTGYLIDISNRNLIKLETDGNFGTPSSGKWALSGTAYPNIHCYIGLNSSKKIAYGLDGDIITSYTETDLTGRHKYIIDYISGKVIRDSEEIATFTSTVPTIRTTPHNLFIFGWDVNREFETDAKKYSFKVYNNNILVRNFIPAKRLSDNELGMYDTITETFFTNSGTGTFIAGPVVHDIKEVILVYIGTNKIWETGNWYGIKWCEETGVIERIGNPELHRTLPLLSQMRRCMVLDDGTVYKYISSTNPLEYEDGTTANYDGTDGQVMVEIPEYYHKSGNVTVDNKQWNYIRLFPNASIGVNSRKCYLGAFELMQDNSDNSVAKGCSVSVLDLTSMNVDDTTTSINASDVQYLSNASTYRNYNYSNVDTTDVKCSYGRPTTNRNRPTFRSICARRGTNWSQQSWDAYNSLLRLYFVEYASFNIQAAFNSTLTADGYKQGGLGEGVTNAVANKWSSFNNSNPFVPCGVTIPLGSNSGIVSYNFAANEFDTSAYTANVPSYRGIENIFGHIWKFIDGFNKQGGSDNIEKMYICNDVNKFANDDAFGYELVSSTTGRASGDFGGVVMDKNGTFWPKPGGYTTIYSDYFHNAYANGTWYTLILGGCSNADTGYSGLLEFSMNNVTGAASRLFSSRLLYTTNTRLPKDYTKLSYIESSGTLFIVFNNIYTNLATSHLFMSTNSEYIIEISYNMPSSNLNAQAAIFSIFNDYGPTLYYNGNNGVYWKFPSAALTYYLKVSTSSNNDKISNYNVDSGTKIIKYKCISLKDSGEHAPVLFARGTIENYSNSDRLAKAKLYSFKMYKDTKLILDCVPCKNSNGIVGLYELVNKLFLRSYTPGTNFIAGNEV